MNIEMELKGACSRALKIAIYASFVLLAAGGLQADNLWSNGAVIGDSTGARCDSGPNVCGSGVNGWTIFDNFNIPSGSKTWVVSAIDFTDFAVSVTAADYKSTSWSFWAGDPLSGGKLVASGSGVASLSLVGGTCGAGSTCSEMFTVKLAVPVQLTANQTYFLGTSNVLVPSNGTNEATMRAFATGGNTAPGGTTNSVHQWEQSNGKTTGTDWTMGTDNNTFPGPLGANIATAFDIQGTLAPEPGTITLLTMALAGCWFYVRRRTA